LANLHGINIATFAYAAEWESKLPPWAISNGTGTGATNNGANWMYALLGYMQIDLTTFSGYKPGGGGTVDLNSTRAIKALQCPGQDCTTPLASNGTRGIAVPADGAATTNVRIPRVSYNANSIVSYRKGPANLVVFGRLDTNTADAIPTPSAKITVLAPGTMLYSDSDLHDNTGGGDTGYWPAGGNSPQGGLTVGQNRTCLAFCKASSTYCNQFITLTNHSGTSSNVSFADGSARNINKSDFLGMSGGPAGTGWSIKDETANNGGAPVLQIIMPGSVEVTQSQFSVSENGTNTSTLGGMFVANPG
jgi:prepilin-type processing-associated H-X9-DG protein